MIFVREKTGVERTGCATPVDFFFRVTCPRSSRNVLVLSVNFFRKKRFLKRFFGSFKKCKIFVNSTIKKRKRLQILEGV